MDKARWREIENLYYGALELSVVERAGFLAANCKNDRELFDEINSLLSAHENSDDFLSQPDFELGLQLINKSPLSLRVNQNFGKYKILQFLGCGGMGEVYLARDFVLKRKVALKLLPRSIASDADRARRFRLEARAASRVVHPNVAHVYEVGEIGGIHFIAMEFVGGATLREHLKKGSMPPEKALPIAEQIASALGAAHASGIVHRDLKPENIMLREDGQVKVLDFSLAKLTRPSFPSEDLSADGSFLTNSFKTEPGILMGTVTYMSPEQARGQKVDFRTDVWSFGVLLYEILAGKSPFRRATNMDTLAAILTEDAAPLDPNSIKDFDKLWHVTRKALRKMPAERYQSADEILSDLKNTNLKTDFYPNNAALPAFSTNAAPEKTNENLRRVTEIESKPSNDLSAILTRSSRLLLLAATCLLLLISGGIWFFGDRQLEQTAPVAPNNLIKSIAILPFKYSGGEQEENLEVGMADALINRLGSLGEFTVRPTGAIKKYVRREVDPIAAGLELKVDAVLDGNLQKDGEQMRLTVQLINVREGKLLWSEKFDEPAAEIFKMQENVSARVAQSLLSKLSGKQKNLLAGKYEQNAKAYRAYLKGQFHADRESEEEMVKAARYYRQSIELDPNFAPAYIGLADFIGQGFGEAKSMTYGERMEKVRELTLKALEIDDSLAAAHVSLASVLMHYDWNWTETEKEYRRAIELNPNFARAYHSYAYYLAFTGRFDEAVTSIQRAQEIDPVSTRIARDVGSINFLARRFDEALTAFENAYEMDREPLSIHMNRGGVYLAQKKYPQAISEFKQAILIKPDYLDAYASLGQAYGLIGQKDKALKTLAEMRHQANGRPIWTYYLIRVYAAVGNKDKAFYWLEKGMEDRSIGVRLMVDPHFDSLRDDPRFTALIRRVRFPDL